MPARPRLDLLGDFRLVVSGVKIVLPTRKAEALLAYLALTAGRAHRRDELAGLLWGERSEDQARHSLRQSLYVIRKRLGGSATPALNVSADRIALGAGALELDVARFETLVARNTREALSEAADLYRGELLADLRIEEEPFEEWLAAERARLRELAGAGLAALVEQCEGAGDIPAAICAARRLVALEPLQEKAHRELMCLYIRAGRDEEALRHYHHCAETLRGELGISPEAETTGLFDEIMARRAAPPLAEASAVAASRPIHLAAPGLRSPPGDADVWWSYQLGLRAMHRFTRRGFREAMHQFREALRREPDFAPALADLAYAMWQNSVYGYAARPVEALVLAFEAARAAVAFQPDDAEARFVLGMIHRVRREYEAAVEEHGRGIELEPTSPRGYFGLGVTRYAEGRPEVALSLLDTAIALGPRDPLLWTFLSVKAVTLEALARYEEAATWAQRALRAPNVTHLPQVTSASAFGHLQEVGQARRALDDLLAGRPGFNCGSAREILSFVKEADVREHYVDGLRAAGLRS